MTNQTSSLSRRNALQTLGAAAGTAAVSGLASAAPEDTVEVNVGFANDAGKRAAERKADEVVREFAFDAATMRMTKQAADGLGNNPNVRYVEENGTMHALAQTQPYGIDQINADVSIDSGYDGAGADVAIIDTGIDSDHPDLQGNLGKGAYAVACSGSGCNYGWDDDNGHGTHCAGTVGAIDNYRDVIGVAPGVTLHAVKVLDSSGGGSYSDIAAGIEYVADQGWDVGSLSLGGGYSSTVADACSYAYNNGVLLIAAAGNSGPCSDCVGYPAALSECVAVSATDRYENLASFSSTGPEVELAAPGKDVLSTQLGGGTEYLSGTSMACPHVSGVGALLMANGYSNTQARSRMQNTADDIGLPSNEQGYGRVDAADALGL
jgi:subtilisin